ncbi:hypothetical protein GCM10009584_30190 [Ornithinimicrobium humiphilum]
MVASVIPKGLRTAPVAAGEELHRAAPGCSHPGAQGACILGLGVEDAGARLSRQTLTERAPTRGVRQSLTRTNPWAPRSASTMTWVTTG